jgi:NAD(P)-dependent dehydrogenase (short-subunit alcohol dehydrogenase family)
MLKLKPLSEQVIVITGASSGIGLATAKLAAQRGAKVVLADRSRDALAQAVDEINQAAGPNSASFVEADVGTHADHEKIAAAALERHGRIDTWVNNAGVLVFGKLEELAQADMRRLFETNFWGVVHGSIVALRHLKPDGGALINVGSLESDRGLPLHGIYSASKHAMKGFTDVLRTELQEEGAPVSVTLVKPGTIATPLPQHARVTGEQEPQFPPPLYSAEEVARTILAAAERPTRTAYVGGAARIFGAMAAVAPKAVDWVSQKFLLPGQISDRPVTPTDNLHHKQAEARTVGERRVGAGRPSFYSAAARNPVATIAVAGGIAAGAFLLTRRRHEPPNLFENAQGEEAVAESPPLEGV